GNDRLVGAAKKIKDPNARAGGIAATLRFDFTSFHEAVELQALIEQKGYSDVLHKVCGIRSREPLNAIVLKNLNQ
ncbi:UNVERIFIED_CONTAM: mannitol-1-phosphate 5-dehydrogenase, partial [Bacillus subtilis]